MSDDVTAWLDAAKARADAATDGPWEADGLEGNLDAGDVRVAEVGMWREDDAEFIAAARTDLPKALDALREVYALVQYVGSEETGPELVEAYIVKDIIRSALTGIPRLFPTAPRCLSCGHELQQATHSAPGHAGVEYALCPSCGWVGEP